MYTNKYINNDIHTANWSVLNEERGQMPMHPPDRLASAAACVLAMLLHAPVSAAAGVGVLVSACVGV